MLMTNFVILLLASVNKEWNTNVDIEFSVHEAFLE